MIRNISELFFIFVLFWLFYPNYPWFDIAPLFTPPLFGWKPWKKWENGFLEIWKKLVIINFHEWTKANFLRHWLLKIREKFAKFTRASTPKVCVQSGLQSDQYSSLILLLLVSGNVRNEILNISELGRHLSLSFLFD